MEKLSNYIKIEESLYDLFNKETPYNFLVGAGVSINLPSCLPSARMLINSLLEYMCPKEVLEENSLNIKYELLIEAFRNEIDPNLTLIDYFGIPTQPNLIHEFLAYMILMNNFVMTTNFDQLIEYALPQRKTKEDPQYQSYSESNEVSVAITEQDYTNLKPYNSKILFKLHGSNKNVFTGENTKDSIVSTMDAIGKGMSTQEQLFVLPLYIHNALKNICSHRNLVVLGYGGGDGLDVLPELARIPDIGKIFWIEHSDSSHITIEKYKTPKESIPLENLPKSSNLTSSEEFFRYKSINHETEIYKIKGNTQEIVNILREIFEVPAFSYLDRSQESSTPEFTTWLKSQYSPIEEVKTFYLAGKLFRVSFDYETAFKYFDWGRKLYLEKHRKIKEAPSEEIQTYAEILANIGMLFLTIKDYSMADHNFRSSYYLYLHLNDDRGMGDQLHNIGSISNYRGKPKDAIPTLEKALAKYNYVNYKYGIANTLGDLGLIYLQLKNSDKCIECMQQSYSIFKEIGDFMGMGNQHSNLGVYYNNLRNEPKEALKHYDQALAIFEQLGFMEGISLTKNNIGSVYAEDKNFSKALELFEDTLEIDKHRGNIFNIGLDLRQIGKIYQVLGDSEHARNYLAEAYEILSKTYPDHQITTIISRELESLKSEQTKI